MNKLILLLLLLSSSSIFGKEKVTLATFLIPRYIESANSGEFVELAKSLARNAGYELELKIYPAKRSLNTFIEGNVDGYFPALDSMNAGNVYKTSNFYLKEDFIFQLKESDYKKIKNPKACLTRGYPYTKEVLESKSWKLYYAKSDQHCLELLKIGRVQLFIGEEVTALSALKSSNLIDKVYYNKNTPISTQNVYFAFSESERGKIFSQKFDFALKKMMMSGEFESILPGKEK